MSAVRFDLLKMAKEKDLGSELDNLSESIIQVQGEDLDQLLFQTRVAAGCSLKDYINQPFRGHQGRTVDHPDASADLAAKLEESLVADHDRLNFPSHVRAKVMFEGGVLEGVIIEGSKKGFRIQLDGYSVEMVGKTGFKLTQGEHSFTLSKGDTAEIQPFNVMGLAKKTGQYWGAFHHSRTDWWQGAEAKFVYVHQRENTLEMGFAKVPAAAEATSA